MSSLKKIIGKVLALAILLILMNYVYSEYFLEADNERHGERILESVRSINKDADIIYIGASSNDSYHQNDYDKRTIGEFVGDYYPSLITSSVTKKAAHAGIFKHILTQIPESKKKRTVVVTLNLRSFGAGWIHSTLEASLQKEVMLFKDYPSLFNRALLSFKNYPILSKAEREIAVRKAWDGNFIDLPFQFNYKNVNEWDRAQAKAGVINLDGEKDDKLMQLACNYIKTYAFQIDFESNPRIADFEDIIELAEKRNWALVFNLLAENVEKGDLLVGEELTYFINDNAKKLESYFSNKGVTVVNNVNCVEDNEFLDQNWTTEHYAEKGRKLIARNVALAMRKFHAKEFQEYDFKSFLNSYKHPFELAEFYKVKYNGDVWRFYNDFESDINWGSKTCISSEKSFQGKRSGFASKENIFGPVIKISPKDSPFEQLTTISINAMLNTKDFDSKENKIVIEVNAEKERIWHGFDLKQVINKPNVWTKFKVVYQLPQWVMNSNEIKVYLLSKSDEIIFIDNFEIILE